MVKWSWSFLIFPTASSRLLFLLSKCECKMILTIKIRIYFNFFPPLRDTDLFSSALTDGKHPAFSWKISLSALILQILKNRLRGHWEVSGSIRRIDGTKYYHGDCPHHLEGRIRVNDATCCVLSFWRMAAISLWALTPHLNSHSRQLTGARGPTYQTAGRWTTQGEKGKKNPLLKHIPRTNETL